MIRSASQSPLRVLHLDDDPFELDRLKTVLETESFGVSFVVNSALTAEKFLERLEAHPHPDILILDVNLAGSRTGSSLVGEARAKVPEAVVLMCSSMDTVETISECLNCGADDFLSKKTDKGELCLRIYHSYQLAKLKRGDGESRTRPGIAGNTLGRIAKRIPLIINSAISAVHIEGESGTGKEVVADLFATALPTATPFVKINCGAITPSLLESELFGHVKGAFTGAAGDKRGLIEAASGGWIFLDEVASLSPSAQVALLRALENQELIRVGATQPIRVNIRVLSATNEPLKALVKRGKFRQDLWQRLCETEIPLPPLRERVGEIPMLVKHFCETMAGGPYQISTPALEVLCRVSWENGNVRELRNCLRAMTELHVNKLLTPLALPERIWKKVKEAGDDLEENVPAMSVIHANRPNHRVNDEIVIPVDVENPMEFEALADALLLELTRKLQKRYGKLSLRKLSKTIGVSRSTLSGRMKSLVQKNIVEMKELTSLVGVADE